jgi:hypothetical protein
LNMDIKMIRPYTEEEKEILRKGLEDGEVEE